MSCFGQEICINELVETLLELADLEQYLGELDAVFSISEGPIDKVVSAQLLYDKLLEIGQVVGLEVRWQHRVSVIQQKVLLNLV